MSITMVGNNDSDRGGVKGGEVKEEEWGARRERILIKLNLELVLLFYF